MFTIRFLKRSGDGYVSYLCTIYEVTRCPDKVAVEMVLGDNELRVEWVGLDYPYDVAYVTNEASKTIDKIHVPGPDE